MELRFDPSGEITIVAGTLSHGQGHETSYAQMVADWLGVPEDKIHLAQRTPTRSQSAAAPTRRAA
jgi:carbon-monoxide dehydrogenase large subunit